MSKTIFVKSVVLFISFAIAQSAKILIVIPTPSISHQVVYRPLIQELLKRDHELTLLTTDPVYIKGKSPNNLKEIDLHDLTYSTWQKLLKARPECDKLCKLTFMYRLASEVFEEQLKHELVQKLITDKTDKFDLLMVETSIIPTLILTHIFKTPAIQISSFGASPGFMEAIGAVTHSFLYPSHYSEKIYNLTIWEKISELYFHIRLNQAVKDQEAQDDRRLQRLFGLDTPPLSKLKNNIDMMFLNIHPIWIHNQPVPSNVVYTWGIHKPPEKILPKDLQTYLDSSKNGVIYMSLGSNCKSSSIPPDILKIILEVFSQIPYNILWKWDTDELPGKSDNIKISKWFPQYDVLRHPNLKLFITQGGLQSTDEAINAGVPLIGIPIFADQEYNTEKYVHFKIGVQLNLNTLTLEEFENAIDTVLTDESYQKNIIHLRTQMHDQPKPALENAVWWIEYVLRHGGARHLRAPAANMSWTEYYELELVLVVLGGLTVLMAMLTLIVYHWCKSILNIIIP